MKRRAWILCVIVAALALAVMWVRSYRVADAVGYGWRFTGRDGAHRTGMTMVRSSRGVVCGYDLRHGRERCPECGTPIPEGKSSDNSPALAKDGVRPQS